MSSCGGRRNNKWEFRLVKVVGILQESLLRELKLRITLFPRTILSEKLMSIWALIWLYNINYITGQSEWWRLHERMHRFVPSRCSLWPARARHIRDYLGTDSVRSKILPLYVPVSPSPVSREASLDLWRSNGPSTMVVFKLRTSLSGHPLCPQI